LLTNFTGIAVPLMLNSNSAILQAEFATNVFERNNDASCAMKVRFKIDE
jgi:hypothetical protein